MVVSILAPSPSVGDTWVDFSVVTFYNRIMLIGINKLSKAMPSCGTEEIGAQSGLASNWCWDADVCGFTEKAALLSQ